MASWGPKGLGYWEVYVARAGTYDITVRFPKLEADAKVQFRLGEMERTKNVPGGATSATFRGVKLPEGPGRLEASVGQGGVHYVAVERRE